MRIDNLLELGAAIREARDEKGLTQSEVARSVGVATEWISRVEKGRIDNPGFMSVLRTCRLLDIDLQVARSPAPENDDFTDFEQAVPTPPPGGWRFP